MRYLLLVWLIALSSCASFAQNSGQYQACSEKAKTQIEMETCANQEAKRTDIELNAVYDQLLSKAKGNPVALEKVKMAERAWIAYRDAYIDAMYPAKDKQAEYGSAFPMGVDLLRAKLSRQQIVALRELLQQYSS